MAGQIIKRGRSVWLVRLFQGRGATGKRLYFNKTIRGTKRDAQKFLTASLRDKDLGVFIEPANISLNEYLDKWLQTAARPRLTERTFEDYEGLLKRIVRPALGLRRLCDVRPLDVQKLYGEMSASGLAPRSVRYVHAVLSSALKQATRWQLLAVNPCSAVELPRAEGREMQAFAPDEAARFLKAAANDSHGIVFCFALATGMRPEEYLALKWSDIDLLKGTATVRRTLVFRNGGGWYFGEPKTSRSRRTVPLPVSLIRSLTLHKRQQMEARLKLGENYQNNDLVFAASSGVPLMTRNLKRRHFKPILKEAKLPENFRLYDLRHSCATLLLAAGENPKVVSERLGHASIVLTLDTYSHVLPSMQRAATEKLESILFAQTGTL